MFVIAITSCATGIAHSYMAAEAIKKACKKKGHTCKVEIQGALGIENQLSSKDIEAADLMIFANDVGISKAERFTDFPEEKIKRIKPHDVIKKPELLFA
jgi:fructose-specific phosphotransferase system IIB component